jgi:hypothetical protein
MEVYYYSKDDLQDIEESLLHLFPCPFVSVIHSIIKQNTKLHQQMCRFNEADIVDSSKYRLTGLNDLL